MRTFLFFIFCVALTPRVHAALPLNGVIQTSRSLDTLLSRNEDSALQQCMTQGIGARYFSDSCTRLLDMLRKKMNRMALEADLQMQAEKLNPKPFTKSASLRIAMLTKINLLSTLSEETVKAAQTSRNSDAKEDLPEILISIQKVQTSVAAYTELFPHGAH